MGRLGSFAKPLSGLLTALAVACASPAGYFDFFVDYVAVWK